MRLKDREKALELRKEKMSYSQIKKTLGIGKSTLSYWLKDYPLSKERIRELRDCNERRIERYRETMRQKKKKRHKKIYESQKKFILPLNKRELFIAGLLLYWGGGTKNKAQSLSISNSDPNIIQFFIYWLNKCLSVPKKRMRVRLQLYQDMNVQEEMNFWAKILKIPISQFSQPYIKKTSSTRINHKGGFGHGTCNLVFHNVALTEKVLMSIKVIADHYQ